MFVEGPDKEVQVESGENQKRKVDKARICKILILIGILLLLLLFLTMCGARGNKNSSGGVSLGVIDMDAEENAGIDLQGMANAVVDESMFQVFINTEMVVPSNGQVDFRIQNTEANFYPCWVEVVEGDVVLYTSDIIPPGYKLESDELDMPVSAGLHNCVAYFHVMDEDGAEINKVAVDVTILSK